MKITDEDVRKAIEIARKLWDFDDVIEWDYMLDLFVDPIENSRATAERMISDGINIEIDLSVTKDEDIAPFLIHNMLNEKESDESADKK